MVLGHTQHKVPPHGRHARVGALLGGGGGDRVVAVAPGSTPGRRVYGAGGVLVPGGTQGRPRVQPTPALPCVGPQPAWVMHSSVGVSALLSLLDRVYMMDISNETHPHSP